MNPFLRLLSGLGKSAGSAPDTAAAIRALTTFVGSTGQEGIDALRRAGVLPLTPRQFSESASTVFAPPSRPSLRQGPGQRINLAASQGPAAPPVRRPAPPVAGVFSPPAQPALRSAVSAPPSTPSMPPISAQVPSAGPAATPAGESFVPLEGRQLDLFSGFNRLRYPAGTTTSEGVRIGGQTYNPSYSTGLRQGTEFVQGLQTKGGQPFLASSGLDEDLLLQESLRQTMRPGPSVGDVLAASPLPGPGLFPESLATPITTRAQAYLDLEKAAANLGVPLGAVPSATQDLGAVAARAGLTPAQIAGGLTTLGGLGLGLQFMTPSRQIPSQQLTDAEAFPEQGAEKPSQRLAALERGRNLPAPPGDRRSAAPGRPAAAGSVTGQTGSGQVVLAQDDRESNYRQARANALAAVPKAAGDYGRIADYYKARQAYTSSPEVIAELSRQAAAMPGAAPQLDVWAAENPALAYELLQRTKARPDLSQQTPQAQGLTVGAQMGDNATNNFVGNVESAGSSVVDRSSGAADLEDATRPLIRPTLNRAPMGGRLIPLGGGYVGEAGRYLGQAAAIS